MTESVRLLDTTLRDGSFSISFQFTASDVAVIVRTLDAAGISYIELGHGSGTFNHAAPLALRGKVPQGAPDEAYFEAARQAAKSAKLGVIVSTYATEHLEKLARYKFDFVRLGVMSTRARTAENMALVERAKSLGLICSINLMQTIGLTPAELAETARDFAQRGADWLYIVDSAGGMLPPTVKEYVRAVRDACDMKVGLHGHHNSGLALANCMAAVEAGASLVDGTIQGLGREVGNAPTEQLLLLLQRMGHERAVRAATISQLGDMIRELLADKGNDPTNYISGAAEIHSANLSALQGVADQRGLPLRSLLSGLAQGSTRIVGYKLTSFPDEAIDAACQNQGSTPELEPESELVEVIADEVKRASGSDLQALSGVLFTRAAKHQKTAVLHLAPARSFPFLRPLPWVAGDFYGFSVPFDEPALDASRLGKRRPAIVVAESSLQLTGLADALVLRVPFTHVLADAVALTATVAAQSGATRVWLAGVSEELKSALNTRLEQPSGDRRIEYLPALTAATLEGIASTDTVVLATGSPDDSWLAQARDRGIALLRPALAAATASKVSAHMQVRSEIAQHDRDAEYIGPLFVPGRNQVVVDIPAAPRSTIAAPDAGQDVHERVARARAKSLLSGLGPL